DLGGPLLAVLVARVVGGLLDQARLQAVLDALGLELERRPAAGRGGQALAGALSGLRDVGAVGRRVGIRGLLFLDAVEKRHGSDRPSSRHKWERLDDAAWHGRVGRSPRGHLNLSNGGRTDPCGVSSRRNPPPAPQPPGPPASAWPPARESAG